MTTNQKGFSLLIVIAVVAVLGVVGFAGYSVVNKSKAAKTSVTSNIQPSAEPTEAPEIKKASDLDNADKTLDKVNAENELGEATSLENEVNSL